MPDDLGRHPRHGAIADTFSPAMGTGTARSSAADSSLLELWDRLVSTAERLEPGDWARPTPDPGMLVRDLVGHVAAGATPRAPGPGGPAELLERLKAAREAMVGRALGAAGTGAADPGDAALAVAGHGTVPLARRLLGAACLDLYVHSHDLGASLGAGADLEEDSVALAEACGYLLRLAPRLLVRSGGRADLRIAVAGLDPAVATGAGSPAPDGEAKRAELAATPAAFVLLLSGRADPASLHAAGALEWSGAAAGTFVERARLFPGPDA